MPSIDASDVAAASAGRDPETLLGPVLWLLTRLAHGRDAEPQVGCDDLRSCLVAHLSALAAHSAVPFEVRLMAGGLAIEHRGGIVVPA